MVFALVALFFLASTLFLVRPTARAFSSAMNVNIGNAILHENPAIIGGQNSTTGSAFFHNQNTVTHGNALGSVTITASAGKCLVNGQPQIVIPLTGTESQTSIIVSFTISAIDDSLEEGNHICTVTATATITNIPDLNGITGSNQTTITDDDIPLRLTEQGGWPAADIIENRPGLNAHYIGVDSNAGAIVKGDTSITLETNGKCSFYSGENGGKGGTEVTWGQLIGNKVVVSLPANKHAYVNKLYLVAASDNSSLDGNRTCSAWISVTSNDSRVAGTSFKIRTATIADDEVAAPSSTAQTTQTQLSQTPTQTATQTSAQAEQKPAGATTEVKLASAEYLKQESFVEMLKINDMSAEKFKSSSLSYGKNVVLSGVTTPNAKVTLYIFSKPRTATVTADAQGLWTYTIQDLEEGAHRLELEVTKQDGTIGKRAVVASFNVGPSSTNMAATGSVATKAQKKSVSLLAAGAALVVVISAVLAIPATRHKIRTLLSR